MQAAYNPDAAQGLKDFDDALFGMLFIRFGMVFGAQWNGRQVAFRFVPGQFKAKRGVITSKPTRFSAAFALSADVAMLVLGGELKRREKLGTTWRHPVDDVLVLGDLEALRIGGSAAGRRAAHALGHLGHHV